MTVRKESESSEEVAKGSSYEVDDGLSEVTADSSFGNGEAKKSAPLGKSDSPKASDPAAPETMDWRTSNRVTPVKTQGECNS